jgi:hypothetical protein
MPLEEANKIIESNMKMLEPSDAMSMCAGRLSVVSASSKLAVAKPRARVASFKSRLGKAMHRLHDLESGAAPEKTLNVDLGVNLYQMEDL